MFIKPPSLKQIEEKNYHINSLTQNKKLKWRLLNLQLPRLTLEMTIIPNRGDFLFIKKTSHQGMKQ